MARYVFFPANSAGARSLTAAKKAVSEHGATVLRSAEGGLLVEATPAGAKRVARALQGWQYTLERQSMRLPERTPLERARLAAKAA